MIPSSQQLRATSQPTASIDFESLLGAMMRPAENAFSGNSSQFFGKSRVKSHQNYAIITELHVKRRNTIRWNELKCAAGH